MPTYEYACEACGHEFEREQRITEDPVRKCPSCGKLKARRLITQSNFILKGGGWYADLYASPSSAPSRAAGSDESASGASASSTSTQDSSSSPQASPSTPSSGATKKTASATTKRKKQTPSS